MALSKLHNRFSPLVTFFQDTEEGTRLVVDEVTQNCSILLLSPADAQTLILQIFPEGLPVPQHVVLGIKKSYGAYSLILGSLEDGGISDLEAVVGTIYQTQSSSTLFDYCAGDCNECISVPLRYFPEDCYHQLLRCAFQKNRGDYHLPYRPLDRTLRSGYTNVHNVVLFVMQHVDLLTHRRAPSAEVHKALEMARGIPQLICSEASPSAFTLFTPLSQQDFAWTGLRSEVSSPDVYIPLGTIHHTQDSVWHQGTTLRILYVKMGGGYYTCDPAEGTLVRLCSYFLDLFKINVSMFLFEDGKGLESSQPPRLLQPCTSPVTNSVYFVAAQVTGSVLSNGGWTPSEGLPFSYLTPIKPLPMETGFYERILKASSVPPLPPPLSKRPRVEEDDG